MDETVQQNLVKFREEAGLTQVDASEMASLSVDNLRRYENGKTRNVPGTVLAALAKVYGHAVDDFFQSKPPPANLQDAPAIFLKTRPNVEVPPEKMRELQDHVDRVNREVRSRRKK